MINVQSVGTLHGREGPNAVDRLDRLVTSVSATSSRPEGNFAYEQD